MTGKARRQSSEGARKERAGCPEWADDKVSDFAVKQAAHMQQVFVGGLNMSAYAVASVGAQLMAMSLLSFHRETCSDPDCTSCRQRSEADPRDVARCVLEFYFRRVELDMMPIGGNA